MKDLKLTEAALMKAEKTALIIIDLQNGIVDRESAPYTSVQVIQNASRLANAFTEKGAFVVRSVGKQMELTDIPKCNPFIAIIGGDRKWKSNGLANLVLQ